MKTNNIWKKEKKLSKKKVEKIENKEIEINSITNINITPNEFEKLVERITKKNMFKSYPNINDIPN